MSPVSGRNEDMRRKKVISLNHFLTSSVDGKADQIMNLGLDKSLTEISFSCDG